ncbi:MAG: HPr family phosphocarrier protein [Anaeromicrobium sp.]|jgi:phosphocarrier protein|uniref:HPr family phosphocarrier protein n=1 Tax=Anaeromicrobium sp. TaxID=1929132 RepID=UPI0025EE3731|nr:HPr family phosphocarrier protein [Anaeromicrobium sp.]MCT4593925.1 HPr family phosphocarrier protein [Anaeromicrobium sp.]
MYKREVTVQNETGLHARPASIFVKEANKYTSNISISIGQKIFNAKSIMGILSAGIKKGTKIEISADGKDSKEAVDNLVSLVESNFGE